MTRILFLGSVLLPLLLVALGTPLVLGKVPPNGLYGFRTARSLSSPELWYEFNRLAGWAMIGAGLFATFATLLVWKLWNLEPAGKVGASAIVLGLSTSAVVIVPLMFGPKG